jgi:hypothetical protein
VLPPAAYYVASAAAYRGAVTLTLGITAEEHKTAATRRGGIS